MNDNYYKNGFKDNDVNSMDKNDDQDFDETDNDNEQTFNINGRPLTFKTGDVAKILGETPAMIRYYCREFEEFIGIEHNPGEHRTFTDREIKYLRYIIYLLKDKNLSVKQAKEFLCTPQGQLMAPIENSEDKVKVFVEMISSQLKDEISDIVRKEIQYALKEIQQPIFAISSTLDKTIQSNENIKETIKEMVTNTIASNDNINRKLNEIDTLSKTIDNMNTNLSKVDQFIVEYRQRYAQREESEHKKGFLSKFFGKK
jgi:DNA-binding transcriptional MerR regulator